MCNIMHVDLTDYQLTKEDKERIHLLSIVEKKGLKPLNLENLRLLERLVEKKDYGTSKKAQKAVRLLHDSPEGRDFDDILSPTSITMNPLIS